MPLWQIEGAWLATAPSDLHRRHRRAGLLGHLPMTMMTMMMRRTTVMMMMMRMMVVRGGGDGQGRGGGGDGGGDVNHNDRGF